MKLSIVSTLYKSSPYVTEFTRRASDAATRLVGDDYEIILVNDGSPDDSLSMAIQCVNDNAKVILIDLARNFGHHKAMMTGMEAAQGDRVFLIDSDLEEDPEWLAEFSETLTKESADVVYGVQNTRKGGPAERWSGVLFYRIFRWCTGISQPDNIVTARLMTSRYVRALVSHREREVNIGGLWIVTGFKQCCTVVRKHSNSPTTYSFRHKVGHLVNAVTSFSSLPLVLTFYCGVGISMTAVAYIIYLLFLYYFVAAPPPGYMSIIASIWLFSGLVILFLGMQGIYIAKIFSEVKQRPYTIVRDIYSQSRGGRPKHEEQI